LAEVNIFHYNTVPAEVISQKYDMYSTIAIKQYKKVTSDLLRGRGYFIVSAVVLIIDVLSFSFFLIQGGTRSLRTPVLRPASQAGPMRNPREGTSVVLRDTIRLT